MAFSNKDPKKQEPKPGSSKTFPKQNAFSNESDTDDENDTSLGAPVQHPPPPQPTTSGDRSRKRMNSSPPRSKYSDLLPQVTATSQPPKPIVKSGPVVLDKFGNFRLATTVETTKPPEPPGSPRRNRSRSRSRGNRKYSSSRSRSKTPRKRSRSGSYSRKYSRSRSRSRSFRSRTRSRSRSRSYSRSRSRSRSLRRYNDRRTSFRNRGGYNERGSYFKPRFNNHPRGRGRGGGNYREYRDYRGGRDRGRPFRPRPPRGNGGGGGGNRYYRGYREGSRDRRYSRDRSEEGDRRSWSYERPRSPQGSDPGGAKRSRSRSNYRDPREPHNKYDEKKDKVNTVGNVPETNKPEQTTDIVGKDATLEEMEKFIKQAKKENKEEMIERNKDIVKKQIAGNSNQS